MSDKNALIQRALVLSLALTATACANLPDKSPSAQLSSPMTIGAAATPPRGYVEFCARQMAECGADDAELKLMQAETAPATAPALAAIRYDWSEVFARARAGQSPVGPRPVVQPAVATLAAPLLTPVLPPVSPYVLKPISAPILTLVSTPGGAPAPAPAQPASATADIASAIPAASPEMTPKLWELIVGTNDRINRAIAQRSDSQVYGVSEYWNMPLEAGLSVGDCEDIVLDKRHALIAAGLPATALSIAVATTARGETHAVLLVATSRGEFVLDSLSPWVLPWAQTGYTWRERQVAGSASHWAMAAINPGADRAPAPAPVVPTQIYASLN